ncbi:MAG TPA: adenylate/guanylate cyclase domain-containing protein [Actinomycetota bacterium]|nr:adenylate/guanylate cyclase domain-containing protein [Actinomycetota bacterium]
MALVGGFTSEELAQRAGVSVDFIDRLVELRIISPGEGDSSFSAGDVRRARFVHGLEQGGVALEAVGSAVQSGDLSFAFFDASYWDRFGGLTSKTYRELSAETGLTVELLQAIRESMGYARPTLDDRVREDELAIVPLLRTVIAMGADPVALERHVRIWGDSMRRIAEADGNFYRTQIEAPLLRAGLSWSDMVQAASEATVAMVPLLDPALLSVYHAQSEHTWMANVVEAVEATLEQAGLHRSVGHPPAMCFLDLSGYTRLTEERGDEAAAEMSAILGKLVQRSSHGHGGRPVKWLGDGVMVYFREPAAAVLFSLEMREDIPAADLPPAHAGIDAGPVIFQDGDYFGRTVNMAARIAAYANAGQLLVSDDVLQVTTDPGVEFVELGSVELNGVSRPVRLHEARRRG